VPGKTFFKHLKNDERKFIPETGMAYPKSEKVQINRQISIQRKSVRIEVSLLHPVGA
jgi:hypothetical protein